MQESTKPKIEFSLLDFGLRDPSMNSLKIIEDLFDYAVMADRLGFKRLWLTEHHIADSKAAWYNPYPLLPLLAGMTKRINVGIAGTQLSIHNPYHIAIDYKLLANLFPDRIDLGLATGRPGTSILGVIGHEYTNLDLQRRNVIELLCNEDEFVTQHEVIIPPYKGLLPDVWLLSSNYRQLEDVVKYKISFSRSLFHGTDTSYQKDKLEEFKGKFFERHQSHPKITLSFSGCCHTSDAKAKKIAEHSDYRGIAAINICGSIERFRDTILNYQELYGYDEFTFLNIARNPQDRRTSLRLIQKAFDL
jgi:alkanesulfonate monooxygenase SsuD/methylene tetrahydromethanopterin reductase-like flavin-dependent oxidoreductase (luciferase family)